MERKRSELKGKVKEAGGEEKEGMKAVGVYARRKRESLIMVSSMSSSVQVWGQDQIPTRPCHDVSLSRRKVI